jgi:outer membrane lipoprotein-sorting protein
MLRLTSSSIFLLLALAGGAISQAQNPAPTGTEIINKMAERYRALKSYQDSGVVQSYRKSGEKELVNSFKTYFVRAGYQFRFEWEEPETRYSQKSWNIVWSDGGVVQTYWNWGELDKDESLSMAVAGATGVSRGAAHTIPELLIAEIAGFSLSEVERVSLLREEKFDGEDCYVVRGFHPFGFAIDLWIGKRDLLLRRMRENNEDGTVDEEVRRDIKVNQVIPAETFRYAPPKNAKTRDLLGCLAFGIPGILTFVLLGLNRKNH